MSTGRNSCPPEWAVQLTNLINALPGANACAPLSLLPLWDPAGGVGGFAATLYNCTTGQVTTLRFDPNLQPVAALPANLQPGTSGKSAVTNSLSLANGILTSTVNGGGAAVALRGEPLQSLGGVSLGYLLPA